MIRNTLQLGHPILQAPNKTVTDFSDRKVRQTIKDLIDTMQQAGLIGLSAPQLGENFQIFITEPRETPYRTKDQADDLRVYINPQIIDSSLEESIIYEGCGSVAKASLFGPVKRPKIITIEAFNEKGKQFQFTADGILGRVIQHEFDHLQGIQFIEKISNYHQLISVEYYLSQIKNSPEQILASKITRKEFFLK